MNLETESFLSQSDSSYGINEAKVFNQVVLHIDMKGAPPKFEFLERLLRFVSSHSKHVVNGVLIEFEDMFPFTGFLQ
jgi:hypothetical protein